MFGIKLLGKRNSYLVALLGVIICSLTLSKLNWIDLNWVWNGRSFFVNRKSVFRRTPSWGITLNGVKPASFHPKILQKPSKINFVTFHQFLSCLWICLSGSKYKIIWGRAKHGWCQWFHCTVDLFLLDAVFHNNYNAGTCNFFIINVSKESKTEKSTLNCNLLTGFINP